MHRHGEDVVGRHGRRCQQGAPHHRIVAARIVVRHEPLVAKEEVDPAPIEPGRVLGPRQERIQSLRRRAAGERHHEATALGDRFVRGLDEPLRGASGEVIRVFTNRDNWVICQLPTLAFDVEEINRLIMRQLPSHVACEMEGIPGCSVRGDVGSHSGGKRRV